ncbi:MAG: hypothetical protein E7316_01090 [Clostridiales bacterium]|nr:hypothetical protein [Clostridiales bacterium]
MEKRTPIAGNTATGWLKLIALIFMFCDHAGKMLLPGMLEMRMLGRIAFPLYCWCMVVGFHYTRSVPKYLLRILLIGLASQPLYMLGLNHTWREPNIFLTLFVALCALWGIRGRKFFSHIWAPVLAVLAAILLKCDYGWNGVLLVLLLYAARNSRGAIAAVMIAFCLYWGASSLTVTSFFGLRLNGIPAPYNQITAPFLKRQALAILSLPLMLFRFPRDVKLPAWVSYALYPAHLVVLIILEQIF